jgi:hypothetical protein
MLFHAPIILLAMWSLAAASCDDISDQLTKLDPITDSTMLEYKNISDEMAVSRDRSKLLDRALHANENILSLLDKEIPLLEDGKNTNCFGSQYIVWNNALERLKQRRDQFNAEHAILVSESNQIRDGENNNVTDGIEDIDKYVMAMNSSIPIEIDIKTSLVKIFRYQNLITFVDKVKIKCAINICVWIPASDEQVTSLTMDEFSRNAENLIIKNSCGTKDTYSLINQGFEFKYLYLDTAGMFLTSTLISKNTCTKYLGGAK